MQKLAAENFHVDTPQRHQSYPNCDASERLCDVR
jgi:hypothetical protein